MIKQLFNIFYLNHCLKQRYYFYSDSHAVTKQKTSMFYKNINIGQEINFTLDGWYSRPNGPCNITNEGSDLYAFRYLNGNDIEGINNTHNYTKSECAENIKQLIKNLKKELNVQ